MKSFNFVFALVVCACVGLSFASSEGNNLLQNQPASRAAVAFSLSSEAEPSDCEKIEETINKEVIEELKTILEKHDPDVFMTKCYSRIYFSWERKDKEEKIQVARDGKLVGKIIFTNCGDYLDIAEVRVDCENKTYRLRESSLEKAKTGAEFVKAFAASIEKNGLPKDKF